MKNEKKIPKHTTGGGNKHIKHDGLPKWYTIFQKNSGGISSKRVIALIGVAISFTLLVSGYIQEKEIPEFAEVVFIGCLSLYGIDVIPSWSKTVNKNI